MLHKTKNASRSFLHPRLCSLLCKCKIYEIRTNLREGRRPNLECEKREGSMNRSPVGVSPNVSVYTVTIKMEVYILPVTQIICQSLFRLGHKSQLRPNLWFGLRLFRILRSGSRSYFGVFSWKQVQPRQGTSKARFIISVTRRAATMEKDVGGRTRRGAFELQQKEVMRNSLKLPICKRLRPTTTLWGTAGRYS